MFSMSKLLEIRRLGMFYSICRFMKCKIVYFRQPAGYGFVSFEDRATAMNVLRELNGKPVPTCEDVICHFDQTQFTHFDFF